jgi:RNA polymerase sigma-70 factor (ECF subfamily)
MNEQEFQVFYSQTAQPLRAYLIGASGNLTVADDLLQESYFRFLRADVKANDDTHRRNYLFRIATNLLRDQYRRRRPEVHEFPELPDDGNSGDRAALKSDMAQALRHLKPRDRQMLWLAYVEGLSHREIGEALGLKSDSLRPMLFRARQRLARVLRERGFGS